MYHRYAKLPERKATSRGGNENITRGFKKLTSLENNNETDWRGKAGRIRKPGEIGANTVIRFGPSTLSFASSLRLGKRTSNTQV